MKLVSRFPIPGQVVVIVYDDGGVNVRADGDTVNNAEFGVIVII